MTAAALRRLEDLRNAYGRDCGREKLALLRRLEHARLGSARELERLHEQLLFLRAYPDDSRVLARVRRLLMRFARRPDLRAQRDALENTGIAGTAIRFPFFWPGARWLSRRWPGRIALDRLDRAADRAIAKLLGAERRLGGFGALDRIRRRGITDAVQFIRLVEAMPGNARAKEAFYDAIEPVIELHSGRGTPNRTLAAHGDGPTSWQRKPLDRARPDLAAELRRPPRRVRRVTAREGERLLDLARAAMATRSRDLDAFAYGDPRAVRIVEDGGGLAFSLNGVIAERQLAHAAPYGALTLRNGVPLGYSQLDMAGRHAEISFNTFPTFRNGEAARIFARALALGWHVLGARRFSIEPYQLGRNNHEAIESGAWWFYYKFGFRPRAPEARLVLGRELARMRESPAHRSSAATLERLANWHLYLDPGRRR
ncbi:MAG: hypothetical protein A3I63_07805 [Betaproteobacteria bacterium RIFCSPLOWO2_02_FULL_66_14]|nr:MAG: hypothetical protein A3I63_07805 [Betaproteobacteria bacterium RIFCSPLOWO2_02_FULL_66_14]